MSELVFIFGFALVLANAGANKQLTDIWDLISNPSMETVKSLPNVRSNIYMLGGELLFVIILSMIAGASRTGGQLVLALIFALWVVWSMLHVPEMNTFFKALTGDVPGSSRSTQG